MTKMEEDKKISAQNKQKLVAISPRIFTKTPQEKYENILVEAIPLGFAAFKSDNVDTKKFNHEVIISKGMYILEQQDKNKYELSLGCIVAMFYNEVKPDYEYWVCKPENVSYDFTIAKLPKGSKSDRISNDGKVSCVLVEDVELTQILNPENLDRVVLNKMDDLKHDYKGRILLVLIKCDGVSESDLDRVQTKVVQMKQNNFKEILFLHAVIIESKINYRIKALRRDENEPWKWIWLKDWVYPLNIQKKEIMLTYEHYWNEYNVSL